MFASVTSSPAGRSLRAQRMTRHMPARACTSSRARCETLAHPKASAMSWSLCVESLGRAILDRARVSTHRSLTSCPPGARSMNVRSNVALWASTGAPATKSASWATASLGLGAAATSRSVMLVSAWMFLGMGIPGFTNVRNVSTTLRPRKRTAAISVS